jgi:hypothetical protein
MSKNNILARRKVPPIVASVPQPMGIVRKNPDPGTVAIVNSHGKLKEIPMKGRGKTARVNGYRNTEIVMSEYECMYW